MKLLPFQQRFTRAALAPGIRTAALSLPRGNGKSTLAGMMLADHLRLLDGLECVLLAGSLEQARPVFRTIRDELGELDWRHADSKTQIGSRHRHGTTTRLRVISSKGKTAMGLVGVPFVVADEPGAWEVVGGELMHSALQTALGKPGSPMRVIYIGTLAPAISGWWHDMVSRGSHGSTHVTVMRGDRKTWDSWSTIRRCNPLMSLPRFPESRATLLEERDDARRDDAKLAQFLSLRLNLPTAAESEMLLTLPDWERVIDRPIPEPAGAPIVGVDLGGNRAWSAAVAIWETGRVEAVAVTPGVPDIDEQERRDRVPAGTYRGLVNDGRLLVADGLNQPEPDQLLGAVVDLWGNAGLRRGGPIQGGRVARRRGRPVAGRVPDHAVERADRGRGRHPQAGPGLVHRRRRRVPAPAGVQHRDGDGRAGHVGQRPAQEARHAQHEPGRRGRCVRARGRRGGAVAARQAGARGSVPAVVFLIGWAGARESVLRRLATWSAPSAPAGPICCRELPGNRKR